MTIHKLSSDEVRSQVFGVEPNLLAAVLASAAEIEDPIGAYSKESQEYFARNFPDMSEFMGGTWRHEERRHAGVFKMLAEKLTGEKIEIKPNSVQGFKPGGDEVGEAYRHAVSRMATEWAATSVYIWLMAHSTGAVQQAISQPMQDEINHLSKFCGFIKWAYGDSFFERVMASIGRLGELTSHNKEERTSGSEFGLSQALFYGPEVATILVRVVKKLYDFDTTLTPDLLKGLFGESPLQKKS